MNHDVSGTDKETYRRDIVLSQEATQNWNHLNGFWYMGRIYLSASLPQVKKPESNEILSGIFWVSMSSAYLQKMWDLRQFQESICDSCMSSCHWRKNS